MLKLMFFAKNAISVIMQKFAKWNNWCCFNLIFKFAAMHSIVTIFCESLSHMENTLNIYANLHNTWKKQFFILRMTTIKNFIVSILQIPLFLAQNLIELFEYANSHLQLSIMNEMKLAWLILLSKKTTLLALAKWFANFVKMECSMNWNELSKCKQI